MNKAAFPACLTIAHALLLASVAGAQSIEAARTAYAEGRFVEAAELAAALETSVAYALAAESLGIHGYYVAEDNDKPTLFDRGILLAQEAIRLDPVNPEAHFQLAHVMGRKAQIAGVMEAIRGGYVQKVRAAIEAALRLNPDMAAAHLSLAAWHVEVVKGVGRLIAKMRYRASRRDALEHYKRALELAPDEIVIFVEYAYGLMLLNENKNRQQVRDLLARAVAMPPKDTFDRILHQLAVERLADLDPR